MKSRTIMWLPFLDVEVRRTENGIQTSVYRKPTHSGIYMEYNSEHTYAQKMSVTRSLAQRAFTHCSSEEIREKEISHIKRDLVMNGYPLEKIDAELSKVKSVIDNPKEATQSQQVTIAIPYMEGLSQHISRILKIADIRTTMKPGANIKNIMCKLKDETSIENTSNCVYNIGCKDCDIHRGNQKEIWE
jgi:hypothetical protein